MHRVLVMIILLTASVMAGVVGDAEDVPRDFKEEPATGIYQRQVDTQAKPSGSLRNSVVTDGAVVRSRSTQSRRQPKSKRRAGKSEKHRGQESAQKPKDQHFPAVPGGNQTWPLLAIAVLLLVAAGGGGYYFYSQSEE